MPKGFIYTPTRFMLETSRYDATRADHAVAVIESLKHTKGEWCGKPFLLLPWQEQIVRDLFGVIKPNGYRQFTHCFVEIGKKSGKSELAAAIAIYLLCFDHEQRAEIYGCANDQSQAGIVFGVAKDMIQMCPPLRKLCKFNETKKRIIFEPTNSFYEAVSKEVATKFGLNIHGCIFDELLGQPDRRLYDTMTKGAGAARKQPLSFIITTASLNRQSICFEVHKKADDILNGKISDPTFYPVVFSAPDDADWTDPAVWRSVNPSLGITVEQEYLQNYVENAKVNIADEMTFRRDFLCQWSNNVTRWMPMDLYDKCSFSFDKEQLKGRRCFGGLDLSKTTDTTAFVLIFPPEYEGDKYIILPFIFVPKENMEARVRRDHVQYDVWHRQGFLHATEGTVVDYNYIQTFIEEQGKRYNIEEIAYDPWNETQLTQNLSILGFKMIEFRQGFPSFNPPTKEFYRLILRQEIAHAGHPVLRWMVENVSVDTDPTGSLKPNKTKSTERIDGAVAAIMAMGRAMLAEPPKPEGGIFWYDGNTDTFWRNGKRLPDVPRSKNW
ncbi:MAG: terminase large subunit [Oscillospiraceae bacterium]|jgi:phage terminase large subunit-like protein|nr:terminase large subunit [Oscillospiraceae bacterium]